MRTSLLIAFLFFSAVLLGQSYNLPITGSNTISSCTGTLYDNNGANGSYSNNCSGSVLITSPAGIQSVTFKNFQLESGFDDVKVYSVDGSGVSTLVGSYSGFSTPNNGNAINITNDSVRVELNSDGSVRYAGFEMSWNSNSNAGQPLNAQFTVSDTNPAFGVPVTFTNTSNTSGSAYWDFGDGSSATGDSVQHSYTSSGTYQARLILQGCNGSDTASAQSITVQSMPSANWYPDTLRGTIGCGGVFEDTVRLHNSGSGSLVFETYAIQGSQNQGTTVYLKEDFETGLGAFRSTSNTSPFLSFNQGIGTNPASGSGRVRMTGYDPNGYSAFLNQATPTMLSFYYNCNASPGSKGLVRLKQTNANGVVGNLLKLEFDQNSLDCFHGGGTNYYTASPAFWNFVEVKNIDFVSQTFDLWLNGNRIDSNLAFENSAVTHVSQVDVSSLGNNFTYFDLIRLVSVGKGDTNLTTSPNSSNVLPGDTTNVVATFTAGTLPAGIYNSSIAITTNSTSSDSLIYIPVEVTIQGTPHLAYNQDTLDFDTVASSVSYVDSIQVINPGCEPLNFSSLSTNSAAFSPQANSLSVAAYDTVWTNVSFLGSSVGLYQDSLSLNSQGLDTTLPLQAYVLGKPVIAFDSASFNRSVNGCLDSIPFSLMLYNQGQLGLQWTAGGFTQFSDDFESGSLNSNFWDVNASNGLVGNHCFVQSGSNSLTMRTSPREVLTNTFDVSQGDSVSFYAASGNQSSSTCESPDGTFEALKLEYKTPSGSWSNLVTVVSTNGLTKYTAQIPVSSPSMRFRFIQNNFSASTFDHYFIDDFQIRGGTPSPLSPASGNLPGSDSIQLSGYLDIENLPSGAHSKIIKFTSNDPLYPDTSITVNIQINGFPQASLLSGACLAYDTLQQGANGVDTLSIANTGCDTLDITSLQSNSGDLSWPGSSFHIGPEDTLNLPVTLSTSSLGAFSDTILVSNNDTALQVCVSAYLVGAPLASVPQDTIRYTLNKCHVVGSTSFQLDNQGQASLNYQLRIGSYQTPFSQKSYSVSGGQTAHTFNGLPTSADSIIITVVLNGDYDNWTERTSLRVDNNYQGYLPDNNLGFQPDTLVYVVPSYLHSSLLSDGSLNIDLNNSNSVSAGSGSFHSVQVRVVENVNWVSFTGATSGSISAGNSASPSLLFNAALLSVGSYNTYASVSSNTPGNGYLSVPILLDVVSEPEIALSDTCVYFSLTEVGDTTFDSLTVYNQGCQPLNLSNMFTGVSSFQVSPSTGTVPVGDSLQVQLSFIPNSTGTFNGTAIINNSDSTRTVCLQGTAAAMPLAVFSYSNENICKGEVSFQHSAQNFNTLFWDFGDGVTSSQPNPLHQYQTPGTYQVILRAQNAIGVDSMTQSVTVNPIATDFAVSQDTALVTDTIAFSDSTNGAVSWTWDFGDGTTSNVQNPTHSYAALGLYTVRLTATDNRNCTETKSRDILVTDKNSLNDWVLRNQVNLYPNPARESTTLSAQGLEWEKFHLKIYNNLGQVVTELKPKTTGDQVKISTKAWEPGLYHLQVQKNARVMARFSLVVQ